MACRATCLGFIVTTATRTSPMTLHLWERYTVVVGNTKRMWKTAIRNAWKSRLRVWSIKQPLHFSKDRYLLRHSLFLLLQRQWSHLPASLQILIALVWCQRPIWRDLPWCQWWALLLLRWCQWGLLQNKSAYGKLHASIARIPNDEISCPSRVASTSHVPMWQVMTQDQTDEELLFNSRTRKTCSSFLPKRE